MSREEELERRVKQRVSELEEEFKDLGDRARFSLTRALIHQAVHFATERPGVEFCGLATYLAEMVGHAHKLAHGEDAKAHRDFVH